MKFPTFARRDPIRPTKAAIVEPLDGRRLLSATAGGFRDVHATNTYNPKTINLRYYVGDANVEGTVVDMKYNVGTVRVALLTQSQPAQSANFLKYADNNKYDGTIIHRVYATTGLDIVQGGGFTSYGSSHISEYAPVADNYRLPNTRGTLAFAKPGSPNSATSEYFFNTADNSTALDPQHQLDANGVTTGGFTVFARVVGGMSVVDKMQATPVFNGGTNTAFETLPLQNYTDTSKAPTAANYLTLQDVTRVSTVTGTTVAKVTASSNKQSIVTTTVKSGKLILNYSKTKTGTATITVNVTGVDGSHATTTFKVRVVASTTTQAVQPAAAPAGATTDDAKKHDVASDVLL